METKKKEKTTLRWLKIKGVKIRVETWEDHDQKRVLISWQKKQNLTWEDLGIEELKE